MTRTIALEGLLDLIDASFDMFMVLDENEKVLYNSDSLTPISSNGPGLTLEDVVGAHAAPNFREAMPRVAGGERRVVVYWKQQASAPPVVFKTGYVCSSGTPLYLFRSSWSTDVASLRLASDSERIERAKELACLYSVGEWIIESKDIPDFFTDFPKYMQQGMQFPEHVVVLSRYKGDVYGDSPRSKKTIRSELVVSGESVGEIEVGYDELQLEPLAEEQKLLDEIARFLCLALDRKALRHSLETTQEEASALDQKLFELETEIEARTHVLEEQRKKLGRVNSYLDDIKGGFEVSTRRLETMFKAVPDMVALIDRDREIVMTNQDDFETGHICHRAIFDGEDPCDDCRLDRVTETRAPVTMEIRNGDTYYEVHALPVFGEHDEVDGIIEFFRDITFKKSYEQQLQQADKLASLGQMVSGIGHEINNPNQFIRGNIKIIKQSLEDMLPIVDAYQAEHTDLKIARLKYDFFRQHIMRLVDDMANGSERIKRIVDSLKGFARKDEGLMTDKVDINNVIHECKRLVHNQVQKSADVKLELAPELPVFMGNAQKLEQVLINLIINASHAMKSDERGLIKVSTELDDEVVMVKVEDNGAGMSESTAKNIFDPFFTTKRARGGTGLGLSIAFRIIEEHHGTIAVESHLGEGTTFTIRIPIQGSENEDE